MSGLTSLISASTALCSALKGLMILEGKTILAISKEDNPSSACCPVYHCGLEHAALAKVEI